MILRRSNSLFNKLTGDNWQKINFYNKEDFTVLTGVGFFRYISEFFKAT